MLLGVSKTAGDFQFSTEIRTLMPTFKNRQKNIGKSALKGMISIGQTGF